MDYANIRHVRKRICVSAGLIIAVFLLGNTVSYFFYQIQLLFRWLTIIAIGVLCCNIWASIVAYNASVQYKNRIKILEEDMDKLKRKVK